MRTMGPEIQPRLCVALGELCPSLNLSLLICMKRDETNCIHENLFEKEQSLCEEDRPYRGLR